MARWLLTTLAVVFGLTSAQAAECRNPKNPESFLPPAHMRQEPSHPFKWMSAEWLNYIHAGMAAVGRDYRGRQMYGFYDPTSGKIYICRGLSGEALRVIRMHEEAHKLYGWRH
jgi:hypothetical protein